MPRILPTAQNMPLLLYVHHTIAAEVRRYPSAVSIGRAMPTNDVSTRGRRQYPSTDAERGNVRVELRCGCECVAEGSCGEGWEVAGDMGGDIRERMRWREVEPRRARP
jgi:hypothetical protein